MSITRVGHTHAHAHAATVSVNYTGTAGNTIIVVGTAYYSGGGQMGANPVVSNGTDTFVKDSGPFRSTGNANNNVAIFRASNIAGGLKTYTFNANNGTPFCNIFLAEYSGLSNSAPLDQSNHNAGTDATTITSGSVTTTAALELLICGFGTNQGSSGLVFTPGGGFALVDVETDASAFAAGGLFDQTALSIGTFQASSTCSANLSNGWCAAIVSYFGYVAPVVVTTPSIIDASQLATIPLPQAPFADSTGAIRQHRKSPSRLKG